MEIWLHDSKSRSKRLFEPLNPDQVTIYVCGPTVYDRSHIGNAVPPVIFDVLVRFLRVCYPSVKYVANITDIEDKINKRAAETNRSIFELTQTFGRLYREDISALGVLPPDVETRATDHIPQIIELTSELIEGGFAYEAEGHVLFHVPAFQRYGHLSNRTLADMIDGARVEVAPYKKDPKDFVLWKPSSEDLPGWESPWGRGRPGWHIECSAMIRTHLGHTIDIHGGGSDLLFPHHENELAQGSCLDDEVYVRYWMHNGLLNYAGEKMAKSVGNIVTVAELLENYDGEVIRYALLSGHYRQSLLFEDRLLEQAIRSLHSLYTARRRGEQALGDASFQPMSSKNQEDYPTPVLEALADDINTPVALSVLHGIATELNKSVDHNEIKRLHRDLVQGSHLLGLLTKSSSIYFQSTSSIDEAEIEKLLVERQTARAERDFERADAIRAQLEDMDIVIEDTRTGSTWRVRSTKTIANSPS